MEPTPPPDPVEVAVVFDKPVTVDIVVDALARLCQQFRESNE